MHKLSPQATWLHAAELHHSAGNMLECASDSSTCFRTVSDQASSQRPSRPLHLHYRGNIWICTWMCHPTHAWLLASAGTQRDSQCQWHTCAVNNGHEAQTWPINTE